jgi:Carboxypeptidase regulatory-like domain/TonB dependent receptor
MADVRFGVRAPLFLRALVLVLLASFASFAQLPTGTVLGTVKDASGASVPGATVTIQNSDTGLTRNVTTGPDGAFNAPELAAGHYQIQVAHEGFKTATRSGITLEVTEQAVINFTMEIGASQQQVVVTGEAPIVNTQNATLGGLVNEQRIEDLPLNGRNYIDLSLIQPGVTQDRNFGSGGGVSVGISFSANGAPVRSNNFMLDGAVLQNISSRNPASLAGTTLGVDGIKEYQVITSNFAAEYGLTMGSQMVIASKGGGNQFHGDGFEYLRNSTLDARNYFDPPPSAIGGHRNPEFRRNNFGGSVGGPIKKDKTFFFGVYEGLRQTLGVTSNITVPGAGCHGPAGAQVWNGIGAQPAGTIGPCPDLGPNPADPNPAAPTQPYVVSISPYIAPFLALQPSPNVPTVSGALSHFAYSAPSTAGEDYGQMRVDHNFSASDTLFGRYTIDNGTFNNATTTESVSSTGNNYPQFGLLGATRNQWLTLSENHIFSPSILNTVRFSFSRTHTVGTDLRKDLPNNDFGPPIITGHPIGLLSIGGSNGGSYTEFGPAGDFPQTFNLQNIYTLSDDVTWTHGKHAFKFGTLLNRWNVGTQPTPSVNGFLVFPSFPNFLLSEPNLVEFATPGSEYNRFYIYNTLGFYGQDDWRISSRLTVNLGLRYEFMTTPRELSGRQSRVLNDFTDPFTVGPIMANNTTHDFSPRIGLAYDVFGNGKTALRAGFGIYYDIGNIGTSVQQDAIGSPPFSGLTDVFGPSVRALYPVPIPLTPAILASPANLTSTPQFVDYNAKSPYMIQYNLSVEQQLPFDMGLTVAYVGNRGVHLFTIRDSNPIIPTSFGACGNPASRCVNGQVPFWDTGAPNYVNVNPNMPSTINIATAGDSYYNALQVILNKRVGHGLEFQSSFTYSRLLDDTQGQANVADCLSSAGLQGVYPLNLGGVDRGPACFDSPYNWEFNALYHFPTISSDRKILSKVANGWWISSIVSVQGGYPFSVITAVNRSNSGVLQGQNDRADLNTPALLAANPCNAANPCAYTPIPFNKNTVITGNPNQWFNPAMFSMAPEFVSPFGGGNSIGQLGTSGRDILLGPNTRNWDFSLVKDTKTAFLGEAGMVEFRAEMFNTLNHPNFGSPSGIAFTGAQTDLGPFSETPSPGVGQITTTTPDNQREIQLVLKVIF